jgi:hypothetical protein
MKTQWGKETKIKNSIVAKSWQNRNFYAFNLLGQLFLQVRKLAEAQAP